MAFPRFRNVVKLSQDVSMTYQFARTPGAKCDALLAAQAGSVNMRIWMTDSFCAAPSVSCSTAWATADHAPDRPQDRE
jgi:hypothetical protein